MSQRLLSLISGVLLAPLFLLPASAAVEYREIDLSNYRDYSDSTFTIYAFEDVDIDNPYYELHGTYPADYHSFSFSTGSKSASLITFESDSASLSENMGDMSYLMFPWTSDSSGDPAYFQITFDLDGSSTSLELMGRLHAEVQLSYNDSLRSVPVSSCQIIVGSSAVDVPMAVDGSGDIDFNDFIYDGVGTTFSSFSLRFYFEPYEISCSDPDIDVSCIFRVSSTDFSVGHLVEDPEPDPDPEEPSEPGLNEDSSALQDNLDDLDQQEQEFYGSMEENFNALDIDSYTIPDGILSGFTLVLSVFSSVWSALGDYQIIFTFPLMLSIVLLIIGRISKYAGHKDSSSDEGGDS